MRDTTDFKDRFQRWKGGAPINELYDCGKPLKKCDTGSSTEEDKTYLPEYEYEFIVTPQGATAEKHKRITNEEDWQKYWGNVGAGYVNKALEAAAPYVLNGMSMLMGNPIGALGGIVGSTFGEELGANWGPAGRTIGGLVGGLALDPEALYNLRKIKLPVKTTTKNIASLTDAEWDNLYNTAIKSGDVDEVLRLRDAHFMAKSNTFVAKDGMPIKTYHTVNESYPADFVEFNPNIEGTHSAIYTSDDPLMSGTYTSRLISEAEKEAYIKAGIENMKQSVLNGWIRGSNLQEFKKALESPETARAYILNRTPQLRLPILTERQKSLYVNLRNPLKIEGRGKHWNNIPINELPEDVYKELKSSGMNGYTTRDIEAAQKATGNYDGVIINDITDYGGSWKSTMRQLEPGTVYLINSPSRLKLSDAITYDNSGNIIPLSKRDNFNVNDIRYGWIPLTIGGTAVASTLGDYDKGKSIHIKPANRGKFNATKKRTGKTTEQLAHSWKDGTPINELYDCGKALKKCDTGLSTEDEDNPWIPKGTKVATLNSEPASAKPKTTYIGDGNQPKATEPKYVLPINPQTGRPYTVQEKDLPLSGTDPIGELWVAGRALTPIFKGLGWLGKTAYNAALPTLGRITKPYTNYFAAQALSNSIDNAVSTPTFSKILPTAEYVWKDIDLPRHLKTGNAGGSFNEEILRINGAFDAIDVFEHPARKQLIDKLSKEAGFPLQVPNGLGTFPSNMLKLTETDADKFLGKNVNGLRDGYNILFREKADPTTPFHELLHLLGFGTVDWDYTKLQTLLDDYLAKGINVSKLESSGAPFMQIRDAKREYYAAEQAYKQLFGLKEDTERFLELKVKSVLKDDAEEYISRPNEFVIHGLQAGRKVGLKPYLPEPTYDPYNTGVPIVDFGKIMETVLQAVKKHNWFGELKLDTPEDYHNAWKVLTGNFLPAAVITGSTFGALQEHDKGKSIHIKPANRGKLTALKKRTGKSEAELYNDGNPAHKKMVVFARNARRWKH